MTVSPSPPPVHIRSAQYRDTETLLNLTGNEQARQQRSSLGGIYQPIVPENPLYRLFKLSPWMPSASSLYVAENPTTSLNPYQIQGFIQVAPFNNSHSTWRVEQFKAANQDIGSQLLRYCLENVWEARTWVLEVNINDKQTLATYRHNGFQPLAQMTYWTIEPNLLTQLAQFEPELPNLLPISNSDAQLLYQLDCVSMPPLLRQVFDRNPNDFKTGVIRGLISKFTTWCQKTEEVQGYVFEPQRKAAIGYFNLNLSLDGSHPHQGRLTVHPAYTWLYPKLIGQMAQVVRKYPAQSLEVVSADYQHEREEYLDKSSAQPIERTLLMSRSVWHKLKETKREGIQLSEVLQGLQPIPRTPIPSRISLSDVPFKSVSDKTKSHHQFKGKNPDLSPDKKQDQAE
ncbi:MAG: GNAT family N-acetyltransferase [Microcystaceae cyanobacterium]